MRGSYPSELRRRVVSFVEAGGSHSEAAEQFSAAVLPSGRCNAFARMALVNRGRAAEDCARQLSTRLISGVPFDRPMGQKPRSKDLRSAWRWSATCRFGPPSGNQTTKISRRKRDPADRKGPLRLSAKGCSVRDPEPVYRLGEGVISRRKRCSGWMVLLLGRPHAARGVGRVDRDPIPYRRAHTCAIGVPLAHALSRERCAISGFTSCEKHGATVGRINGKQHLPARGDVLFDLLGRRGVGGFHGVTVGCGGGVSGTIEVLQPFVIGPNTVLATDAWQDR
jgi:hypothetical protein